MTTTAKHVLLPVAIAALLLCAAPSHSQGLNFVAGRGLGPPNNNRVQVFDDKGIPTPLDFYAYGAGQWGTNVAAASITWGVESILTGPGPGGVFGPHVRGFKDAAGIAQPMGGVNFYAYGTLKFGVNVGELEFDRNEEKEILTGPGPGAVFGPHVRGWDFDGTRTQSIPKINFFAYFTLRYGVNPVGGDVDGDGYDEIITAPGPGAVFAPQVRGWNGDGVAVQPIAKISFHAFQVNQLGANVASGDVDMDAYGEILAAKGPGPSFDATCRGFDFDGKTVAAAPGYSVTPFTSMYGGRVGTGFMGSGAEDLIAGAGRDPNADSTVSVYSYNGSGLQAGVTFKPFATGGYGVNASGAAFGY